MWKQASALSPHGYIGSPSGKEVFSKKKTQKILAAYFSKEIILLKRVSKPQA